MSAPPTFPGLYFEVRQPPAEPSPLRSDVAGFVGRTRRGPVGTVVRLEGWRACMEVFGGLDERYYTPYSLRGYFENGGEVAWVYRLPGNPKAPGRTASALWVAGTADASRNWEPDSPGMLTYPEVTVEAASLGSWADGTLVDIRYELGALDEPVLTFTVRAPEEPPEVFSRLPAAGAFEVVNSASRLIRLIPGEPAQLAPGQPPGPRLLEWSVRLGDLQPGEEPLPSTAQYRTAVEACAEQPEIALFAIPDLFLADDAAFDDAGVKDVLTMAVDLADRLHDRQLIVDLPAKEAPAKQWLAWWALSAQDLDKSLRSAALYHPWLRVPDPLGGLRRPLRTVPPSGHVAGLTSRLDRERGAHHTPANATLFDAIDLGPAMDTAELSAVERRVLNPLVCSAGRGLQVWGGRTLQHDRANFLAHRRLIHRLVRGIRRVAEPLVFDINGPELRLALARAITSLLLESWRAGALQGQRPDEAFHVKCDEANNPPEEMEAGRLLCEIGVAPAVPMEFITLRIELGTDGLLEVFE